MTDRAAVVLAGGFATRFGDGDKTLATLEDRPLLVHACEALAPVVDDVVVSCRDEQIDAFERTTREAGIDGVRFHPDETPDEGPLAGLAGAVGTVDAPAVAVATADMPRVPAGLWRELFAGLDANGIDAVAITEDGYRQPVPSVVRTGPLRRAADACWAAGDRRLGSVFEGLSVETLPAEPVRARWGEDVLADVNTRAALRRLETDGR